MAKSIYSRNKDRLLKYIKRKSAKYNFNLPDYITELLYTNTRRYSERQKELVKNIKSKDLLNYAVKNETIQYEIDDRPMSKDVYIDYYLNDLKKYSNGKAHEYLITFINGLLSTRTDNQVSEMLERGFTNGLVLNYRVTYNMENAEEYVAEMLDFLPDIGENEKIDFIDALDLIDYSGYND